MFSSNNKQIKWKFLAWFNLLLKITTTTKKQKQKKRTKTNKTYIIK